jgi:hypothetical protein
VRNEPNLGPGTEHRRHQTCKTNPICTHGEESVGQAPPSKWARVRQTNPVQPGRQTRRGSRKGKCAKRTQSGPGTEALAERNVRNEPTSRRAGWPGALGAKNAKQTQFGQAGRQAGSPARENVRNEPNLTRLHPATGWNDAKRTQCGPGVQASVGRMCKTNPIPQRGRWAGAWGTRGGGVVASNKANLPGTASQIPLRKIFYRLVFFVC